MIRRVSNNTAVCAAALVTVLAQACAKAPTALEPIRSVAAPGLIPVQPTENTDKTAQDSLRLAKGTGTPADQALARGDDAYLRDQWDEAERAYEQAANLAPTDPAPIVGLVRSRLAKADTPTAHAADPQNAALRNGVGMLRRALHLDPAYGPAHLELGRALLVLDESEEAAKSLRRAAELLPNDPEAHSALGVALVATGHVGQAVQALRRSVDLDPSNVARQSNLATALLMHGQSSEAIRILERAVMAEPADARLHGDLGTAYLAVGETQQALVHLRRAVALAPDRATFRSNLCYGLTQVADDVGAEGQCRSAIALDSQLGSAWVNLGVVLSRVGRIKEAREAFERALVLDPTDPRPQMNLEEL